MIILFGQRFELDHHALLVDRFGCQEGDLPAIAAICDASHAGIMCDGPPRLAAIDRNHVERRMLVVEDTPHFLERISQLLKELDRRRGELDKYRDRPIIAYCRSGNRSGTAGSLLRKNGFQTVYNLGGGNTARKIIPLTSGIVGMISGVMQNVGATALFLPVMSKISSRT